MKKKITFAGGWIIVHSSTGTDELAAQVIAANVMKSYEDPTAQGFWTHFGLLCSQTEASQGLPFRPENVKTFAPGLEMQGAYEAYLRVSTAIRRQWTTAVNACNTDDSVQIEDVDPNSPAA